ncbi:hypothetical protein C8R47DRAFT_1316872 [Mycena vitilis]|nr:hypothetical protein C8R47DRAFT_1316872 [Mycena vitilis]
MSSSEQHLVDDTIAVTLGVSIPGIVLSVFLLATIAGLQLHPVSRPQLDRVSFRLLTYALVANVVFGVVMLPVMKETSPGCSLVAFLVLVSPLFSACMFCSMALNLQLVLVYGVNGNRMEKIYVVGAILLCGACTIPAWAAGALGWQTTNGTCWIRDTIPTEQLHWLLITQSVPMVLMSTLELFSFLRIHHLHDRTPALYPLLSCFLSVTACILDVYGVQHNTNITDFVITLGATNLFVYCLRPILYTLLAATDPSFLRAVRSLQWTPLSRWRKQTEKDSSRMVGQSSWGTGASQELCLPNELSMAEAEEYAEEELRSESIGQQL